MGWTNPNPLRNGWVGPENKKTWTYGQLRLLKKIFELISLKWKTINAKVKWVFPKIEVPQNGWFIMENPIKMDDLGGKNTPIFGNTHIILVKF